MNISCKKEKFMIINSRIIKFFHSLPLETFSSIAQFSRSLSIPSSRKQCFSHFASYRWKCTLHRSNLMRIHNFLNFLPFIISSPLADARSYSHSLCRCCCCQLEEEAKTWHRHGSGRREWVREREKEKTFTYCLFAWLVRMLCYVAEMRRKIYFSLPLTVIECAWLIIITQHSSGDFGVFMSHEKMKGRGKKSLVWI
jgi:hypothetical protein